jgi:DNA-binding transcriptional MerR regulator/uncharacterized glyoxalase superfamily protein PhnB
VIENTGIRIGQLAERTGMTVRTLRYYEEIGLVGPASRTPAGQRIYGPDDVERLYQVAFLRSLRLPLDHVRTSLRSDTTELRDLIADHMASLDEQLAAQQRLRSRLAHLVDQLGSPGDTTGALLNVLEDMNMTQPTVDRRLSILVCADIDAAFEHLVEVFALGPGEVSRDEDGNAVHAAIRAGDGEVWLHPESQRFGLASPVHLGGASATMAVMVDDVDAHHQHALERGATIRYGPVDQPYGYREYSAVDPEGHLWSFMKALG